MSKGQTKRILKQEKPNDVERVDNISNLLCRDFPIGCVKKFLEDPIVATMSPTFDPTSIPYRNLIRISPGTLSTTRSTPPSVPLDPPGSNSSNSSNTSPEFIGDLLRPLVHRIYTGWHARKQTQLYTRAALSRVYTRVGRGSRMDGPRGGWEDGFAARGSRIPRRPPLLRVCVMRRRSEEGGGKRERGLKWAVERHWIAPGVAAPTNPN